MRPDPRQSVWGIAPEALPLLTRYGRGDLTEAQVRAELESVAAGEERPEIEAARSLGANTGGGIAIITLQGMITPRGSFMSMLFGGGGGLQAFREALREAVGSEEISTILLMIDSPGGRVDLVPETAADVRAATKSKRVVAIANTLAASAAYWIGSQAEELIVTPSGDVGSVGVFCVHEDFSKWDERLGVTTTLISAGKYKTEGNPYEPLSDEAKAAIQEGVDEVYDMFVADVAKGRGASVSDVRNGYGEGRCIGAQRAVALGLADRVDTFENTVGQLVKDLRGGRRAEDLAPDQNLAGSDGDDNKGLLAEMREQIDHVTESLKED